MVLWRRRRGKYFSDDLRIAGPARCHVIGDMPETFLPGASRPRRAPPTAEEEEREASKRVLKDDSLRYGDIVSTDPPAGGVQGMFVRDTTAPGDFVPLMTARLINSLDSSRKAD
jgi:hypothetical protein